MREDRFSKSLMAWFKKNARKLPWRETSDPYKIWISEVMLQQTTVSAVIPYYERWIKAFPTLESVAKTPLDKILRHWQGLGYYERARNIHKAARMICRDYQGRIPADTLELKKLPGFGSYTTGAVLSIAFDQRHPIIDANVRRVMMRQLGVKGYADSSWDPSIHEHLKKRMPRQEINIFNQALMELGALICRNKAPLCLSCPVNRNCLAYQKGIQDRIPALKKRVTQKVDVAIALIRRQDFYFIQRRPPKGLFADLWEFPGGKIGKGESPQQALYREMQEELNVSVQAHKFLFVVDQFYTQFRARLQVFECVVQPDPSCNTTHKWVKLQNLPRYAMPSGSVKIVNKLLGIDRLKNSRI